MRVRRMLVAAGAIAIAVAVAIGSGALASGQTRGAAWFDDPQPDRRVAPGASVAVVAHVEGAAAASITAAGAPLPTAVTPSAGALVILRATAVAPASGRLELAVVDGGVVLARRTITVSAVDDADVVPPTTMVTPSRATATTASTTSTTRATATTVGVTTTSLRSTSTTLPATTQPPAVVTAVDATPAFVYSLAGCGADKIAVAADATNATAVSLTWTLGSATGSMPLQLSSGRWRATIDVPAVAYNLAGTMRIDVRAGNSTLQRQVTVATCKP